MDFMNPVYTIIGYWLFNAAVQALPKPSEAAKPVYVFVFNFAHLLAANVGQLGKRTNGGSEKKEK